MKTGTGGSAEGRAKGRGSPRRKDEAIKMRRRAKKRQGEEDERETSVVNRSQRDADEKERKNARREDCGRVESEGERKKRQIHLRNAHRPSSALFSARTVLPLQPPTDLAWNEGGFSRTRRGGLL